ncbi:hypothetical protein AB6A40_008425 [Gnathostoma spinigerum]|uniref:Uncharacterized protein n=1 Tax=Gnathostoma spinigerum TaxID=75299 RepID=A0ABD6EW49_9BILA
MVSRTISERWGISWGIRSIATEICIIRLSQPAWDIRVNSTRRIGFNGSLWPLMFILGCRIVSLVVTSRYQCLITDMQLTLARCLLFDINLGIRRTANTLDKMLSKMAVGKTSFSCCKRPPKLASARFQPNHHSW